MSQPSSDCNITIQGCRTRYDSHGQLVARYTCLKDALPLAFIAEIIRRLKEVRPEFEMTEIRRSPSKTFLTRANWFIIWRKVQPRANAANEAKS